jgi:osmotically-inducible protein OsmY
MWRSETGFLAKVQTLEGRGPHLWPGLFQSPPRGDLGRSLRAKASTRISFVRALNFEVRAGFTYAAFMKRMLFCFLLGLGAGVGGYWYLQQDAGRAQLAQAKSHVVTNAQKVTGAIRDTIAGWSAEDIREEMARSSMVVREKAAAAGQSIAGAAANARVTAAIKTKLVAEPGLSAFSINVDTTDGLVTLSGKVVSHEQVSKAVKLALETDGVHKVISTLQISAAGK